MIIHVANPMIEPKELPRKDIRGIRFQGSILRPCVGLTYWIRWGRYCFDIREVWKIFHIPETNSSDLCYSRPNVFRREMNKIRQAVGCENFLRLLWDAQMKREIDNQSIIQQNHKNGIDDDIPF